MREVTIRIIASMSSKGKFPCHTRQRISENDRCYSIRYAAPPLGELRFAAPQKPAKNRTTTPATVDPPICPQTGASSETPAAYGLTSALGNEDCLFLNVYAPANATNLPVFFWIRKSLLTARHKMNGQLMLRRWRWLWSLQRDRPRPDRIYDDQQERLHQRHHPVPSGRFRLCFQL
jgi:hypothetical protein